MSIRYARSGNFRRPGPHLQRTAGVHYRSNLLSRKQCDLLYTNHQSLEGAVMPVTLTPVTPTIGLQISGMTADAFADPQTALDAQRALDVHGVVVYREVHLSDDQLLGFSRMLGTLVAQPTGDHRQPEIQTITLDPAKTHARLASYRHGNFHWHIDGATDEVPQKATLLTAREVDPAGGDTEFANTYAAYAALSESERV